MPVAAFDGEVIVVDKPEMVADAVAYLRMQQVIGVDTEARPSFTRDIHYPTALVQIASRERCYLFRLTHIGMPQELAELFANPDICKVGLAFKDDINGLRRRRNFTPSNCVDVQSLVSRYGIFDLGLQKVFAICFGQKISKAQIKLQKSDQDLENINTKIELLQKEMESLKTESGLAQDALDKARAIKDEAKKHLVNGIR